MPPQPKINQRISTGEPVVFDADYFTMAYGRNYERRPPLYKWQAFLRELLKFQTGGDLLEVGCGFGLFLPEASRYFNCIGGDISVYAMMHARRRFSQDTRLFCADLGHTPLRQHLFDVVAAFDVLEHIAHLPPVFKELSRLLKPSGTLIFTVPVYDGPLGWLVKRLDQDPTHIHRCGRDFWLRQVLPYFTVKYYTGVWRYFLFKRIYLNYVSYFSRRWGSAILVVAEKKLSS